MNASFDLRHEHDSMAIILNAMKKLSHDIGSNQSFDRSRCGQIIDFLRTYNDCCHHEKEEKILFPALLEYNIPWTADVMHALSREHETLRGYITEIDDRINAFHPGQSYSVQSLSTSILRFVQMQENHIKIENKVLLPMAEKVLTVNKQEIISRNFRQIQDQKVGHQKHLEFYILLSNLYSDNRLETSWSFSY